MKIATFNINNVRKRLPNLLDWMRETSPDVVCLQELKATDAEFPVAAIRDAGYEAIWRGQKTWNGVGVLSRTKPIETLRELPGDPDDKQSRYIEAAVNGILVASLYAPNGNPSQVPSSNTSSPGFADYPLTLPSFWPRVCLSCLPATTTLFRQTRTSIHRSHGTRTRSFSPRAGLPLLI
jgi:hypothetical protein